MNKKKEIYHEKEEFCNISKQKIDTEKEDYCIVIDCRGDNIMRTEFYKNEAFKNMIKGNQKQNVKKAENLLNQLRTNLNKQFGNKGEAFEIQ